MATHPKKERAALAGGLPRQILSFNVRNQQGFKVNKNLSG